MTLLDLVKPELVLPKMKCSSKNELFTMLAERVYSADKNFPISREALLHTIDIREKIGGTLLPSGLSVPHARLEYYDGFMLILGTPMEALFHEERRIHLMALMITSKWGSPYYLPVLAEITKISRDEEYFSRLCGADDSEDFISILRERNPEIA